MNNIFESCYATAEEKVKECLYEIGFPSALLKKAIHWNEALKYDGAEGSFTYTKEYAFDLNRNDEYPLFVTFRLYSDNLFSENMQHFEFTIGLPDVVPLVLSTDEDMRAFALIMCGRKLTWDKVRGEVKKRGLGKNHYQPA